MRSIWWVRDDLRLADNPALVAAAAAGEVIAVHVDEDIDGVRPLGGASRWWLHHSLRDLAAQLREHDVPLVLADGDPREVLPALVEETGAGSVTWMRRYHAPRREVDAAIKADLRERGIEAESFAGHLLHEPWTIATGDGNPYRVYTPFARACREAGQPAAPQGVPEDLTGPPAGVRAGGHEVGTWLREEDLDRELGRRGWEPHHPDWAGGLREAWTPGERGARERLDELDEVLADYDELQDRPDRPGTSRLAAPLRFGEVSVAEVWHRSLAAGRGKGPETFRSQLLWRDFAWHRLYHLPTLATENIKPRFDRFAWRDDAEDLAAWQRGRTGVAMVDAGMRELWKTGSMHNRARMVVGSFLTKNLRLHWRHGEEWFWDTLVDADEASNPFNWQWVAGSGDDAAPFFRIFNPERQRERFDPEDAYVRRWVPELDEGLRPIVDLSASRREALDAYERSGEGG